VRVLPPPAEVHSSGNQRQQRHQAQQEAQSRSWVAPHRCVSRLRRSGAARVLRCGQHRQLPIRVALQVADVSNGKLEVLDSGLSTVDGLMAATAASPLFPPVRSQGRLYVDAANVANQTTEALMNYLRDKVNEDATAVHVYNVASLPLSRRALGPPKKKNGASSVPVFTELVEVIRKRGYRLITLEDALNDLIYSLPDTNVGEEGTGWLDHWAITRGKPPRGGPEFPAWVIERAKAIRKTP